MANELPMQLRKLVVGNYVALYDSNLEEDDHFHLCEVLAIEDDKAILLNYATWTTNIKTAVFSVMYQERNTLRYTTQKPLREAKEQEVIDQVSLEEADEYIDHYDIKLTNAKRISAKSIKQLKQLVLHHHVLGKTFP